VLLHARDKITSRFGGGVDECTLWLSCVQPKLLAAAGLPNGLFANQKSQFGYIFEGLRLENVDIFYGHLEHLRTFGKLYDHLVNFVLIWYIFPVLVSRTKKNLATLGSG
jgi:hypothetical protein